MIAYTARLVLHESVYYATHEMGRLYETGRYLHNYALTYALGLATAPYFCGEGTPSYAAQITPLNERGVYVTPAYAVALSYTLATFKYASNAYHVQMEKGSRNTPSFGRAKELAVGSEFLFAVLSSQEELHLPRWIRLGIWMSKASLEWETSEAKPEAPKTQQASLPLNPLDLPAQPLTFDLVSMPPASLVDHVTLQCAWWVWKGAGRDLRAPAEMQYNFPQ